MAVIRLLFTFLKSDFAGYQYLYIKEYISKCCLCDKLVWNYLWLDMWVLPLEAFKSWAEGEDDLGHVSLESLTQLLEGLLQVQSAGSLSGQ